MDAGKREVIVIGAGTAGLFVAYFLVQNRIKVRLYCNTKTVGRKFLVAGKGGFNLTNNEADERFLTRYSSPLLQEAYKRFNQDAFRKELSALGIITYVGTSGRVFPIQSIKPYQVLYALLKFLDSSALFSMHTEHEFESLDKDELQFSKNGQQIHVGLNAPLVFALGGSSWMKTGSNGNWLKVFERFGIKTLPFHASNARMNWKDPEVYDVLVGGYLKNIAIFSKQKRAQGEIVFTKCGIEGSPVYALNDQIRSGEQLWIDLKVDVTQQDILNRLKQYQGSITERLKRLKLSAHAVLFLKMVLSKEEWNNLELLATRIKSCPLHVAGLAPIDEAISTVGGVCSTELTKNFELKSNSDWYCIGEMIDWDAPTGGYLIQGCVSSAFVAANEIARKLNLI